MDRFLFSHSGTVEVSGKICSALGRLLLLKTVKSVRWP